MREEDAVRSRDCAQSTAQRTGCHQHRTYGNYEGIAQVRSVAGAEIGLGKMVQPAQEVNESERQIGTEFRGCQ